MVPKGWKTGKVSTVIKDLESGISVNGEDRIFDKDEKAVLKVSAVTSGTFNPNAAKVINIEEIKRAKTNPQKGQIIISRSNTEALVGASAFIGKDHPNLFLPDKLWQTVPQKNSCMKWLSYLLASARIRYALSNLATGTSGSMKNITKSALLDLAISIPPHEEQKKIAQILSTWDKAITTTEQLLANSQQQKKALMQQLLTGKKRLLDDNGVRFSGDWKYLTFDETFKIANKKSSQVKSSDFLETGLIPIVDQSQKLIAGYCNIEMPYSNLPVIVFGDHTRCIKWVDFVFCPGADGTQVLKTSEHIEAKFGYYLLCNTDIPNLGYSRHMRELKEKDFKAPLMREEQQKIAAVLSAADQEIDGLQQKIDALKQEKKALMQQLLTGKRRVKIEDVA